MTFDFLQDAVEELERNGYPYLLVVEQPNGKGAWVSNDLDRWHVNDTKKTVREDIHQLLDVTVFNQ